jgi:peptide/nickel transport system ATP-binding protein
MIKLTNDVLLKVIKLKKYFPIERGFSHRIIGYVRAVDDVSFSINVGETMGLVGESGSGKTTIARSILRATNPTEGKILFKTSNGQVKDIALLDKKELKKIRCDIQMVFQDPYSSLDSRMTVMDIIAEPLKAYGWRKKNYIKRVSDLLKLVALDPNYMSRYPHSFSGGQRQRISIARALALNPSLIVADEPVSALDVSIQAQILNLFNDLRERLNLSYLMITHDLSVVSYFCDKVAVMYLGRLVEVANKEELYKNPLHPYTSGLLKAVPDTNPHSKWGVTIKGEIVDSFEEIKGCSFASRCDYATDICREERPILKEYSSDENRSHLVTCHRAREIQLEGV